MKIMSIFSVRCMMLVFALCLFVIHARGQFQVDVPQVKPLPPDVASLLKVVERPVGTYTGTVPVSFPLFGVSSGSLKAGLTLDYNGTGGIRVEEMASSVGLGFSLNGAGGFITQVINDLPDESNNGMLNNPVKPSNWQGTPAQGLNDYLSPYTYDLEPDVFMYNIKGQSGKFFFQDNGTLVMMQKTGLKIIPNVETHLGSKEYKSWKVIDEAGNTLYFGKNKSGSVQAVAYSSYDYSGSTGFYSAGTSSKSWYLTEEWDMNEENKITYTYVDGGYAFVSTSGSYWILGATINCNRFNLQGDLTTVTTGSGEKILSRIDAATGYIVVNSAATRQDGGGRKVSSIELRTPGGTLKKKFRFNYGYFSAGSQTYEKRLKLLSFSLTGTSTDSLRWQFQYNDQLSLPSRYSHSVDHWGFYRGSTTGSLTPNIVYNHAGYLHRIYTQADRSADPYYGVACTLKKITYPTGGTREFVYEGNTAHVTFNINEYTPDASNTTSRGVSVSNFSNVDYPQACLKGYFTVNDGHGSSQFSYSASTSGSCGTISAAIYKTTSPEQTSGGTLITPSLPPSVWSLITQQLVNGYYRIEITKTAPCSGVSIYGSWWELTLSLGTFTSPHYPSANLNENIMKVGGVRVKEVRDYDPVSNKTSKTTYWYKLYSSDSTKSSGLLIIPPKYVSPVGPNMPSGVGCGCAKLLTSSKYPLSSSGGSYVVYPEVRTRESGNGWVDRIFSYAPDAENTSFPLVPPQDNSLERGRIKEEKYYKEGGTLLKKIETTYTNNIGSGPIPSQGGVRARSYWYYVSGGADYWYEYSIPTNAYPTYTPSSFYSLVGYPVDKLKTTETTYTSAGNHELETEYTYESTTSKQMFVNLVKTKINQGTSKYKRIRYSFTSNNSFTFGLSGDEQSVKSTLATKNYMAPLEVVDSYVSGSSEVVTGGYKVSFDPLAQKLHPNKLRTYTSPTDYSDLHFSRYNTTGQLQEQYKDGDIKETYLWGYSDTYPVAKITGSDYSTAMSFVNSSVLNTPPSAGELRYELNKIRVGLAGTPAQVETYTHDHVNGMTSFTDVNGRTTFYTYDAFGRLALIMDYKNSIVNRYVYNYQGSTSYSDLVGNVWKDATITKACPSGYYGSTHSVTIGNNWRFAATQSEADAIAQSDATALCKQYVDAYGTCTPNNIVSLSIEISNGSWATPYQLTLTNLSTSQQYVYSVSAPAGGFTWQTLGQIEIGTYQITIINSGNPGYYYWYACDDFEYFSTSGTLVATFSTSCKTIYVDL